MYISDINDPRVPQWFKDAQMQDQEWQYNIGRISIILWYDGTWKKGTWKDGSWQKGTWQKGTWQDGIWYNGTWKYGKWQKGKWQKGTWQNGTWQNGSWHNGTWKKGVWYGGTWYGGTWQNGTWKTGWIYDPDRMGNHQNDWKWDNDVVQSPINPKQYFKDADYKIKDINHSKIPHWFKDAQKRDQKWYYDTKNKLIVWQDGTWINGTWYGYVDVWKNGTWEDGTWHNGIWQNGTWKTGWIRDPKQIGNYQYDWQWKYNRYGENQYVKSPINPKQYFKQRFITDIDHPEIPHWIRVSDIYAEDIQYDIKRDKLIWRNGIWSGDYWNNGTWEDGVWTDGIWSDGTWENGIWQDGTWQKGAWKHGHWVGGVWQKGTWRWGWIYDPERLGNYQDDWQWTRLGEYYHIANELYQHVQVYHQQGQNFVLSEINPKQYFKGSHKRIPRQLRDIKNVQKYMNMSDQQLVKLVGYDSVQQWLDEWVIDQFTKFQFILIHKDELNQSIFKLTRGK